MNEQPIDFSALRKNLVETGRSLRAVRDKTLYRATHESFDAYCVERFGLTPDQLKGLIEIADAADRGDSCAN